MAPAYPSPGRTWTVTQRHEGLDVLRSGGPGATLQRKDAALWFRVTTGCETIRAAVRSGGSGRLTVVASGGPWRMNRGDCKATRPGQAGPDAF
jgi:hypothetical protein